MVLFGAGLCQAVLALPRPASARLAMPLRRVRIGAALIAVVSAVGWLMLEAGSMGDGWRACVDLPTIQAVLDETGFGQIWRWRLILLAVLLVIMPADVPHAPLLRLAVTALFLGSLGLTGHALVDDGPWGWVNRASHITHLLATGAWVGGLVPLAVLACTGVDADTSTVLATALRRFSGLGYLAVGLVLLTGAFNASILVTSPAQLPGTTYGRVLLLKLALVAGMIGLALLNRLVLLPRLGRAVPDVGAALRRGLVLELALGGLVLAVVGVLGILPPAAFAVG